MKKQLTSLLPCFLVFALDFYLLPLLMHDTGGAMFLMLLVMPLTAFLTAVIYGVFRGFSLLLPLGAGVLFLPSVFLFYNATAWSYGIAYAAVVLAGNGLGRIFYRKR